MYIALVQSGRQGLLTMCICACVCLPDRRLALVQSGRQGLLTVCVSPRPAISPGAIW